MSRTTLKSPAEIDLMDRANRIVRSVLEELRERVRPGITTAQIDAFAEERIRRAGGEPAFKGYPHRRDGRDFPATVCASLNDEVVHGIPSEKVVLTEGDILSVDCGVLYKGYFGDAAETYPVGTISPEAERLLVLVIDDEPQIRKFLEISLRTQGYQVALAESGGSGLERLAVYGADLVILDLGLPDLDGRAVLQALREWSQVPVIVLTVRAGESEKVASLDAGANDYVTKPFGVQELMARVRALLRSSALPAESEPVYDDGSLRVDLVRREVFLRGEPLTLSRKEYALLSLLVRHAGRVVTQPQVLRELWGPTHQEDTHYLRILVAKLRQKLGDDAASPRWIATEPGVGLRFLAQ